MGVCCWHQLPSVLSRRAGWSRGRSLRDRPAARQHTRELMSTTHTHPWLIPIITWYWLIWLLTINILLTKCKSKFESRAILVRVAMLPRNFEDKYHSRPHPLLMKCEARAISRDPVLMRAIELRCTLDWCHLPGDDDASIMRCCLKASFLLHTALANEIGELYRSMVYPCPNRSVYFSVGSPGWWKLVIVQAGVPSWSRWRDAPLVREF